MFSIFARKTKDPVTVEMVADIEIDATCQRVFASLDLRSPSNRYLARGWSLTQEGDDPGTYRGVNPQMPDLGFIFREVERQPRVAIEIASHFADGAVVGSLLEGRGRYLLTPLPEDRCMVELLECSTLRAGLTSKEIANERMMLMFAVTDDLARLKALIEHGPEAAEKAGALDEVFEQLASASAA